jgi:glycosyltransferase involved in cell wall biosynthesis
MRYKVMWTELLQPTKVLLYPTRADAFPTVVLEALSCGTPVVAYAIPAVRLNFDTPAVLKVEPLNIRGLVQATMHVLKEGLWERLENQALNFASMFTWDRVAQAEWKILTTLAKQ